MTTRGVPANDYLLDDAVRHAHAIERYKSGTVRSIFRFLNREVYPDLLGRMERELRRIKPSAGGGLVPSRKLRRLERMFSTMDGILRTGMSEAYSTLKSELYEFSSLDAAWQTESLKRSIPPGLVGVTFDTPAPTLLRSIVTARPFQGKHLREHWAVMTRNTREAYRTSVRLGMAQGESIDGIVRRVRGRGATSIRGDGVLPASRREIRSTVRTAVNHVSAHARESTFRENDDVVKQVRYVATLDARTTDICASLDGKVFNIDEGPRPPMHHQCRSTVIPVLKSWKELGIPLKEAPIGTRASMNGQVPADVTYGSWLRRQPASVQNEVLGRGRAQLFREGMPIEKFVDSEYRSIGLEELRRIAARS